MSEKTSFIEFEKKYRKLSNMVNKILQWLIAIFW